MRMPVILPVQECQSYSKIHCCISMLQFWQRTFAYYLIPSEEKNSVDPEKSYHTPRMVLQTASITSWEQGHVILNKKVTEVVFEGQ